MNFPPLWWEALGLPRPAERVKRVVFHQIPLHPDELVAYWLLWRFGESMFPGIREAEIVIRTDAGGLFEGKEWHIHWAEGTLLLGTGGGPLDEHAFGDEERKKDECCATLAADILGISQDPALHRILEETRDNDVSGKNLGTVLHSAEQIRCTFKYPMMKPEQVIWMWLCILEPLYQGQMNFQAAADELPKAITTRVKAPHKEYLIIAALTANEDFTKYARSKHANTGVSLIIIRNPKTGETFISPHKDFVEQTHIDHIARIVRLAENKYRGRPSTIDMFELAKEGATSETPEWYFVHDNLHNRVVASAIPLDELTRLIAAVLSRKLGSA